jgi:hypothetical protein
MVSGHASSDLDEARSRAGYAAALVLLGGILGGLVPIAAFGSGYLQVNLGYLILAWPCVVLGTLALHAPDISVEAWVRRRYIALVGCGASAAVATVYACFYTIIWFVSWAYSWSIPPDSMHRVAVASLGAISGATLSVMACVSAGRISPVHPAPPAVPDSYQGFLTDEPQPAAAPELIASDLVAWQAAHQASDTQLAEYLKMPVRQLSWLAANPRPVPGSPTYHDDLHAIADYVECDWRRLAKLLQEAALQGQQGSALA